MILQESTAAAQLRFLAVEPDDPLAQPLLAELAVEYSQRYGGTPEAHFGWLPVPSDKLAPPDGGLLIGLLDGVPVTGGAFLRFDGDTVEFKRIWTDSGYRRRGYAKALLAELEATAALVFAQALPGCVAPGPDESRSYAQWLGQRPGGGSDAGA